MGSIEDYGARHDVESIVNAAAKLYVEQCYLAFKLSS
jgi:hypothetical protein